MHMQNSVENYMQVRIQVLTEITQHAKKWTEKKGIEERGEKSNPKKRILEIKLKQIQNLFLENIQDKFLIFQEIPSECPI